MPPRPNNHPQRVALIFAGGIGLGAYQAGAYAALHPHAHLRPTWLAGASVGAINAALIVGTRPDERLERLKDYWNAQGLQPETAGRASQVSSSTRHVESWLHVLQARLFGSAGHFRPRFPSLPFEKFSSLYDLAPMRARLERLIDFGRLNSGEIRLSIALTDIETGDPVIVDTGKGQRIELDHLLATCGFLPEFAPMEIEGRVLGDGALAANAPVEAVLLEADRDEDLTCFVVDLYARDGERPDSLEAASERKSDLIFGNQTFQRLIGLRREFELRARIATLSERLPAKIKDEPAVAALLEAGRRGATRLFYLSYRAAAGEAGPEKPFDLSRRSIGDRWRAGSLDMEEALRVLAENGGRTPGLSITSIRRASDRTHGSAIGARRRESA